MCIPESLRNIYDGRSRLAVPHVEDKFPDWFDLDKFKKGQEFVKRNYFSVAYSELVSLYLFFSIKIGREPLIYTGMSDTPDKNYRRYFNTVLKLKSWYEGDITDFQSDLFKEVKVVRQMHSNVCRQMNGLPKEVRGSISFSAKQNAPEILAPWSKDISHAFEEKLPSCPCIKMLDMETIYISQTSMSLTQFGFMGLVSLYPEKFGIFDMTDEDMGNFHHFWRTLGYFLGIEEEFNYCIGNNLQMKQRIKDTLEFVFKPHLMEIDESWEHLSRGMAMGVSVFLKDVSFESTFLYLCWVIEMNLVPELYKRIGWKEKIQFWATKFVMTYLMRFSAIKNMMNRRAKVLIESELKRHKNKN